MKVLIKNLAYFFLFPNKEFLPTSFLFFKIQLLQTSPQKQKEQRQKQLGEDKLVTTQILKIKSLIFLFSDVFSLPVHFEFFAIFSHCLHAKTKETKANASRQRKKNQCMALRVYSIS